MHLISTYFSRKNDLNLFCLYKLCNLIDSFHCLCKNKASFYSALFFCKVIAQAHLRDFLAEVRRVLSSVCQPFTPLPLPDREEELVAKLKNTYLGGEDHGGCRKVEEEDSERGGEEGRDSVPTKKPAPLSSKEFEMKTRVCRTVLTSYDMSLRDSMQLALSKLRLATGLIEQLGGGKNNVHKEESLAEH